MVLGGKVWRAGHHWLIECPAIDAETQGYSKIDALRMMKSWVRDMMDDQDLEVEIHMVDEISGLFEMTCKDIDIASLVNRSVN